MDAYAPCPCGSGKKVKFCCQAILPEMQKVIRLLQNNQPRMALQILDKLLKDHPQNAWIIKQRAIALLQEGEAGEARDGLVAFLRKHPDDPSANVLLAVAVASLEPVSNCKKVIHRAFLKGLHSEPQLVVPLISRLIQDFQDDGKALALRQHLALLVRLEQEEDQRETALMALFEIDSDIETPYPFRGVQRLPNYQPGPEQAADVKKAHRLAAHICYAEAADLLDKVAETDPDSAALWQTIGLLRAWDGDHEAAAQALHRGARLEADEARAVDLETIAQLLDIQSRAHQRQEKLEYAVEAPSRLLTRLDNSDRLYRLNTDDQLQRSGIRAAYVILDRPQLTTDELQSASLDQLPEKLGILQLHEHPSGDIPPRLLVVSQDGRDIEQIAGIFEQAAGDLARRDSDRAPLGAAFSFSHYAVNLFESMLVPATLPAPRRREFHKERHRQLQDAWLDAPCAGLNGRTPREAAADPQLRIPLLAAIHVLDALLNTIDLPVDVDALRDKLGLEPERPAAAGAEPDLHTLTVPELLRLDLSQLNDELFDRVMQRALLIKHPRFSRQALEEFLNRRPALRERNASEIEAACGAMAELSYKSYDNREALRWIERGIEHSRTRENAFELELSWKMRELLYRSTLAHDEEFTSLLNELWNNFGTKLPGLRPRLEAICRDLDIVPPWGSSILTPQLAGSAVDWTGAEPGPPGGEKKLWLPD